MHLFSKENIWSNPQQLPASCIHPNNNSVDRIISKEEEREDPRRDSSIYLRVQNTVVFPQSFYLQELQDFFEYSVFYSVSTRNPASFQSSRVILHTELILLQEILQLQGSSHADHYKASSSNCSPCPQAFYTAESSYKAPSSYSTPSAPHSTSRLPAILPGRNSIPSSSQHPRTPYSSSQASSTLQNSTRRNRILSKRVKYCISNAILRSVCSNLLILALRITLQEFNSIQSSSNSMRRNYNLSSIQIVLVAILHKIH